ncbi:Aste57867_12332 [Aphanomyces stellatus]|uniref:Aste57867_12332 protein n=1 Tax=Aphanomyces stellatus TaxID=120398 RepID=A0A485KXA4_9STRA|nr:hypothetical protein As57867_012286 [Aphanomyces stellatus]VFT89184.1 Aste57867_12332 [Aphanomyces stellatus]
MQHRVWLVAALLPVAASRECSLSDKDPLTPFQKACADAALAANDTDAIKCAYPTCRAYYTEMAKLPCTINGQSQSYLAHLCDNFVPQLVSTAPPPSSSSTPTTPKPCPLSTILPQAALHVKCHQVSGYRSFADITNATALQDYCSFEVCVANTQQYTGLDTCTINGVVGSTYASLCDNVALPPRKPKVQLVASTGKCAQEVLDTRVPLGLKCEQASGIAKVSSIESLSDLAAYCSYPVCVAYLEQYTNVTCAINGVAATYFARLCRDNATTLSPPPAAAACTPVDLGLMTPLSTQCQQASTLNALVNVTSQGALQKFCAAAPCVASLRSLADLPCSIAGAPAKVLATLCDPIVANDNNSTATPSSSIAPLTSECTDTNVPRGLWDAQARCFHVAGLTQVPRSYADLQALCQFVECASAFKLYATLTCRLEGIRASRVAETCVGVPQPTVANPTPTVVAAANSVSLAWAVVATIVLTLFGV